MVIFDNIFLNLHSMADKLIFTFDFFVSFVNFKSFCIFSLLSLSGAHRTKESGSSLNGLNIGESISISVEFRFTVKP